MRKLYTITFFLFYSLLLVAQEEIKTVTKNLNLRIYPGVDQKILCVIPANTNLAVDNSNQEFEYWTKVKFGSKIGYVYSEYLKTPSSNAEAYQLNSSSTKVKYYTNSSGERVQSPTYYQSAPAGATAICRDGTYSFSRSRRGTCSHHGGVLKWL